MFLIKNKWLFPIGTIDTDAYNPYVAETQWMDDSTTEITILNEKNIIISCCI